MSNNNLSFPISSLPLSPKSRTNILRPIFRDTKKVKWTSLKIIDIILKLKGFGINVGGKIIKQLLKKHNYVSRKPQKKLSTGESEVRDAQFKKINKLKKNYLDRGEPVLSIDTRKKRS